MIKLRFEGLALGGPKDGEFLVGDCPEMYFYKPIPVSERVYSESFIGSNEAIVDTRKERYRYHDTPGGGVWMHEDGVGDMWGYIFGKLIQGYNPKKTDDRKN